MDSFNDLAANGGHNGQQMAQMSAESTARVRPPSSHYLTDHMPPQHRTHYNSPPMETQMRRPNTSYNDSISELTKQTNLLSFGVNDKNNYNSIGGAGDLSNNSWIASEPKGQSSQSLSSGSMAGLMDSKLSPFAKEFIPRTTMSYPTAPSVSNGWNANPGRVDPVDRDFDDFIACTYLREFIDTITIKPNKYDSGIAYLTELINSYIDEDDEVLVTIVNIIVDQAIVDPQFRYNGVRLCTYFMDHLIELSEDKTFKLLLFKRCQREHTRRETLINNSDETQNYMRGVTMFIGDLYARSSAPELAEYLPQLLLTLLSKVHKENLKCVCQVLKLCGSLLESHYNKTKGDDMNRVMEELKYCLTSDDISVYVKELVHNILDMQKRGWTANMPSVTNTPLVNPYLNTNLAEKSAANSTDYYEEYNYSDEEDFQASYDFGQCGDEDDSEVCDAFEEFLKNSGQN